MLEYNICNHKSFENSINCQIMIAKLRKRIFLLAILLCCASFLRAQNDNEIVLKWTDPIEYGLEGVENEKLLNFTDAQFDFEEGKLPFFYTEVNLSSSSYLNEASLKNAIFETLNSEESKLINPNDVASEVEVQALNMTVRKQNRSYVRVVPFRKNSFGQIEKLVSFELDLKYGGARTFGRTKSRTFASESKLKNGDWYKIAVTNDAVCKLSYSFLKRLGVEVDDIDPRNIKLYGYGGGMLPELNSEDRPDDMLENAIVVVGEQDGVFNKTDYVLFYGEDQVDWRYDESRELFRHRLNLYSDTTYYFINIDNTPGKRIAKETRPTASPDYTTSDFSEYAYHEEDVANLIKSGQLWVGELFDAKLSFTYNFNIPNVNTAKDGTIELSVFARSGVKSNFFTSINGQRFNTEMGSTNLNRYEYNYATASRSFFEFTPNSGVLSVNLEYNKPQSVSKGWLNSITLNLRRNLNFQNDQLLFRDPLSIGNNYAEYIIQTPKSIKVWDITDLANIKEKEVLRNGNQNSIIAPSQVLREFIAFENFDTTNVFAVGKVANQNLHGIAASDLVIVSHPLFVNEASRLADFHRQDGLTVSIVTPQQIYNEFSSGSQDLVAIRSFFKMFYDRSTSEKDLIKYAIMLGDASYDYKDRISGNTNFVPAYQASNSLDPVSSYVSDDYFALLDDNEGTWKGNTENLDIAIGRFPVQTASEAAGIVDKILNYNTSNTLKDWRNRIVFVGDDEDGVIHMAQANDLSKIVDSKGKAFNSEKIFLEDGYIQGPFEDPTGKFVYTIQGVKVDENELIMRGLTYLDNDSDAQAYLNQKAMFASMDMTDDQATAFLKENDITAKKLNVDADKWDALTPVERYTQYMKYKEISSAVSFAAAKYSKDIPTLDWKYSEAYKNMMKNQNDISNMFSTPMQIPFQQKTVEDWEDVATQRQQVYGQAKASWEDLASARGITIKKVNGKEQYNPDGTPQFMIAGHPVHDEIINQTWINYQQAKSAYQKVQSYIDNVYEGAGIDANRPATETLAEISGTGSWKDGLMQVLSPYAQNVNGVSQSQGPPTMSTNPATPEQVDNLAMAVVKSKIDANNWDNIINPVIRSISDDEIVIEYSAKPDPDKSYALLKPFARLENALGISYKQSITIPIDEMGQLLDNSPGVKQAFLRRTPQVQEYINSYNENIINNGARSVEVQMFSADDNTLRTNLEKVYGKFIFSNDNKRTVRVWDVEENEEIFDDSDIANGKHQLDGFFYNPDESRYQFLWSIYDDDGRTVQRISSNTPNNFESYLYSGGFISPSGLSLVQQATTVEHSPTGKGYIGYDKDASGNPLPNGRLLLQRFNPNEITGAARYEGGVKQDPMFYTKIPYIDPATGQLADEPVVKTFYSYDDIVDYYFDTYLPLQLQ